MSSFSVSFSYWYFNSFLHFISWDIIESPEWQTVRVLLPSILPDSLYCMHVSDLTHYIVSPPSAPHHQTNPCIAPSLSPPALPHCPHPSLHPKPPHLLVSPPSSFKLNLNLPHHHVQPLIPATLHHPTPRSLWMCCVCCPSHRHFLHHHCSLQSPSW